jgi:hypothetical protein
MRITVNIPDELAAQAQARGLTPESFVEGLIGDAARATVPEQQAPVRDMESFFRRNDRIFRQDSSTS